MKNIMKRISVLLVLCTVMLSCSQGSARTVIENQTKEKPQAEARGRDEQRNIYGR